MTVNGADGRHTDVRSQRMPVSLPVQGVICQYCPVLAHPLPHPGAGSPSLTTKAYRVPWRWHSDRRRGPEVYAREDDEDGGGAQPGSSRPSAPRHVSQCKTLASDPLPNAARCYVLRQTG